MWLGLSWASWSLAAGSNALQRSAVLNWGALELRMQNAHPIENPYVITGTTNQQITNTPLPAISVGGGRGWRGDEIRRVEAKRKNPRNFGFDVQIPMRQNERPAPPRVRSIRDQ